MKSANHSFYWTFQATPEETENQYLHKLGTGQWDVPLLLDLLKDIVPKKTHFDDFEVACDFPKIGPRVMLLNARKLQCSRRSLSTPNVGSSANTNILTLFWLK